MNFVREGRLPIDLSLPTATKEVPTYSLADLKTELGKEEAKASKTILANIQAMHKQSDLKQTKKVKYKPLKVGEWVMVRIPHPETAAKSGIKANGPYKIYKCISKNTYKLVDATGKKPIIPPPPFNNPH